MTGLLDALDGDDAVDVLVDDAAFVRAMLEVENALAAALVAEGIAPAGVDTDVAAACATLAQRLDDAAVTDLGVRSRTAGNPAVPLVADLVALLPDPASAWAHRGATSQDVVDTALVLLCAAAVPLVVASLDEAAGAAAGLADRHRDDLAVARTLGQAAVPTTVGVRAAVWCSTLDAARARLERVAAEDLAAQLGGAAGTASALGPAGLAVQTRFADVLGLADPGVPWHTDRGRVHVLAVALASAVAACGKVAADVVLLAGTEVGEVAEGGGEGHGGSSAMPHKRNPVTSVLVVAAARRAPGLVATLLAAGVHEQERATGAWHAEWAPLRELLRLAGGAAVRTASVLGGLVVDPARALANLEAAGPGVLAEQVATVLSPALGRAGGQAAVRRALTGTTRVDQLLDGLRSDDAVRPLLARGTLVDADLVRAVDPRSSLGAGTAIVDHAVRGRRHQQPGGPR